MKNSLVRHVQRAISALVVVSAVALTTGNQAHAGFISIQSDSSNSTEELGSFTGSIDYTFNSGSTGTIVISLTNTSVAANAGLITGFVFNIDSTDADATATLQTATHPFLDTQGGNAAPFGADFDAGAALGGNFLGGGSPQNGIAVGETGTFTFQLVADDASSLTAEDFINGPYAFDFIVRFKGFANGGSDKVPAMVVPEPSAVVLLGLGLLGVCRRRRRSA
jgi:hypothetical protein